MKLRCRYATCYEMLSSTIKKHTVLPTRKAAVAPRVAPIESATNPTGNPNRYPPPS